MVLCCSVLQCVAVCCSVLQCVDVMRGEAYGIVLQCVAVCCSVLQCVAVMRGEAHGIVLQREECVALSQCVATCFSKYAANSWQLGGRNSW